MNGEYLLYLQEIKDTEWVIELISEQFDDAMNMMTPNSVIYGGAVRDCLAGKDLIGDLDIAVSASECTTMINKFVKNPKWVNISNIHSGTHYKKFGSAPTLFGGPPRRGSSPKTPQIMAFKTLGNKTVQIIVLEPTGNDPFQTVTTMVKQVDIVCCGVILTNDNKVFEVVPNAYKDCKKHVLHLNNTCYVKDIDNFKRRIEKLSERGWINEINITKVIRTVNRKRKQNLENKRSIAEISKHTSVNLEHHTHNIKKDDLIDTSNQKATLEEGYVILRGPYTLKEGATGSEIKFNYAEGTETLTHTGYQSILSSSDIGSIGGLSDTLHALKGVAKKYRLDIIVQPIKDYLIAITKNKYVSNQATARIMKVSGIAKSVVKPPITNKKLDEAVNVYAEAVNPPKYKLNVTNSAVKAYGPPDSAYDLPDPAITTHWQAATQIHGKKVKPPIPSLSKLNKRKELNGTRTERYFNYSTDTDTTTTEKHYRGLFRSDIDLLGGIAMVIARLERIAKRHKTDVGIIVEHSTTTLITIDEYTSRHIYNELLNKATLNTKSSGGVV